jgi:hypothetical protein
MNDYLGTLINTRKGWLILYYEGSRVIELLVHPSLKIEIDTNQSEIEFKIVKSKKIKYGIITKYICEEKD